METISVDAARRQLSRILARFREGDHRPVRIGSSGEAEVVLVPVKLFRDLIGDQEKR